MKLVLWCVLSFALIVRSRAAFDVFSWPSFRSVEDYNADEEYSHSFMDGLKDITSKILDFKRSLFGFSKEKSQPLIGTFHPLPAFYDRFKQGVHSAPAASPSYGRPAATSGRGFHGTSHHGNSGRSQSSYSSYGGFSPRQQPREFVGFGNHANHASGLQSHAGSLPDKIQVNSGSWQKFMAGSHSRLNAPLSAAMTLGHLTNPEEIRTSLDNSGWRPIPAPTSEPLPLNGQYHTINSRNPAAEASPQKLRVQPLATTPASDVLLIEAQKQGEEEAHMDEAAFALGHIADTALFDGKETPSHSQVEATTTFGTKAKSLESENVQENIVFIGQESKDGKESLRKRVIPGIQTSLHFGEMMEELQLNTFMALVRRANLEAMLTTEGGFTIFAPSDSAFKILPRSVVESLQNDTERLREVVLFHVMPGIAMMHNFVNDMLLTTASPNGRKLRANVYDHGSDLQRVVTVNGARIKSHDMMAANGVVHVLDRPLYPVADMSILQHLESCDAFTGANVAVTGASITDALDQDGPFTFLVPTTAAFAVIDNDTVANFIENISLLQDVLMFHIIPGTYYSEGLRDGAYLPTLYKSKELPIKVTTDGYSRRLAGVGSMATVLKSDIVATNGVIHVIDMVLRPEQEELLCGQF